MRIRNAPLGLDGLGQRVRFEADLVGFELRMYSLKMYRYMRDTKISMRRDTYSSLHFDAFEIVILRDRDKLDKDSRSTKTKR